MTRRISSNAIILVYIYIIILVYIYIIILVYIYIIILVYIYIYVLHAARGLQCVAVCTAFARPFSALTYADVCR
jgi:hypothetical protein